MRYLDVIYAICDGAKISDAIKSAGLTRPVFEDRVRRISVGALLPRTFSAWRSHREAVRKNVALYLEWQEKAEQLKAEYQSRMTDLSDEVR